MKYFQEISSGDDEFLTQIYLKNSKQAAGIPRIMKNPTMYSENFTSAKTFFTELNLNFSAFTLLTFHYFIRTRGTFFKALELSYSNYLPYLYKILCDFTHKYLMGKSKFLK